jgi:hypothetical protein
MAFTAAVWSLNLVNGTLACAFQMNNCGSDKTGR